MSTNKIAVQAKINEIETGVLNPASTVRDVLKDDPNSILEAIYSAEVQDDEVSQTYTTANANFEYDATLSKVGGDAMITGRFKALNSVSGFSVIFTLSDSNFTCLSVRYNDLASNSSTFDTIPIFIGQNELRVGSSILAGEQYYFTIKYKTLN